MAPTSNVYIAGVGHSPTPPNDSSSKAIVASLVSAGTKALLDAGLTFDDITHCVVKVKEQTSGFESEALKIFHDEDVAMKEVEGGSELDESCQLIREHGAKCAFMITIEKSATMAVLLVSEDLLWRHPYLKDSSAVIQELETSPSNSDGSVKEGIVDICQMVWTLRGWSQRPAGNEGRLCYKDKQGQYFEVRRADANAIPDWKAVEHKQDGKHRLGYNPATETREISLEDFEAVKASKKTIDGVNHSSQFNRKGGDRAALAKL